MNDKLLSWSFFQIANEAAIRPGRDVKPRDYLWATDLGKAPIDVYHSMLGTIPTNPPNDRSMRKFHAGDIWEFYAYLVLYFAGVLRSSQDHLRYQYPGLLEVTGRQDFIAGGKPDWAKAEEAIRIFPMTDPIRDYFLRMVELFKVKFADEELAEIVIECKSVGSYMFPVYQRTNKPSKAHSKQIFHYLKAQNRGEGHVVYISKDDSLMLEFGVFNPSDVEIDYKDTISMLTDNYRSKKEPVKEKEVVFDEESFKFSKNWKIEYSNYLTMIYGYKEPEAYRERWDNKISSFNRCFTRLILSETGGTTPTGKPIKLTPGNLEALAEAKAYFPEFDSYAQKGIELKKKGDLNIIIEEAGV